MLTEDYELFFETILIIFENLNVVDALLQLLVILLFKSIDIENKEMSIVAADPRQPIVHSTAEKPVATRLLHNYSAQVLVIHMQLVAFASGEDQTGIVGGAWWNKRASPITDWLTALDLSLAAQALW